MTNAAAAFHELDLLFVGLHDTAVRVGLTADHEAVGQGRYLKAVTDAGHGASLGYDVAEMIQYMEEFLFGDRIGIALFDAGDFGGDATVHVGRCLLIQVSVRIFQRIFIDPYAGG